MAERVTEVEGLRQCRRVEAGGDLRVGGNKLPEVPLLVPGGERVSLHQPVRVVTGEPRGHEREKHALAEDEAVRGVEVSPHPLGVDDEPVDEPREAVEHVVEGQERVRENHPLRARVGDVALVPEGDVLEADDGGRAHDAGEAGDSLRDDRVPLVRHRR